MMKKKLIIGFFCVSMLVTAFFLGCLNNTQESYETSIKPSPIVQKTIMGKKNVVMASTPTGMVRIKGKF